jgi:predicted transcriptional regulator
MKTFPELISIRVDQPVVDLLKKIAAKEDRTVSYVARRLLLKALNRDVPKVTK